MVVGTLLKQSLQRRKAMFSHATETYFVFGCFPMQTVLWPYAPIIGGWAVLFTFWKYIFYRSHDKNTIEYDQTQKKWLIYTKSNASLVLASSEASHASYALGKHSWLIQNDSHECSSQGEPYQLDLKLSGCDQREEFTCNDGECVPMRNRCDQVSDCRDESDESGCQILVL